MVRLVFAAAVALCAASVPIIASAAESLTAVFTKPDGGQTVGLYSGTVSVTVSGTGVSFASLINDAFYLVEGPTYDPSFYQLTFSTAPIVGLDPTQNAVNFIVGGLPAYQPSHVYTFLLDTGTAVPSILHFGVGDGAFADNEGAFEITVSAIPEPAAWSLMIGGFAMAGIAVRRRREAIAA